MPHSPRSFWSLLPLAVACWLTVVQAACGAEYFVATSGRDESDGKTAATALRTVGKGVATLRPGDTLTILPGTYFEAVSARISGTPEAPITIRARRPGTVLLRGDVDAPRFEAVPGMRYTFVADFAQGVEGVADRSTLRLYDGMSSLAAVEQTLGSFFHDVATKRLYVHTSDSGHPDRHALAVSVTNGFGLLLTPPGGSGTVHDVVVDGLSFTGYQAREFPPEPGMRNRWGLFIPEAERVTVRRCTSFLNSGGIGLLAPVDSVVEDCHAFANVSPFQALGNNILGWSAVNTVFRRNRVELSVPGRTSSGDITFYGGARSDKKPLKGTMEDNHVVNAGLMIKGGYGQDSVQRGNVVMGQGAYFYRKEYDGNLLLPAYDTPGTREKYADPPNHDFRPQPDPQGEVFFVSPDGDDANAGTSIKQAWRTLAHAARTAAAGHTVYVREGEYHEPLVPARSGTADKPLLFLRHGRGRVVLDGGGKLPIGVDLSGRSHVTVRGFTVRGFTRFGILAKRGEQLRIEQMTTVGPEGDAFGFAEVAGLNLSHNLARRCAGAGLRLKKVREATVTGNLFDSCGGPRMRCDAASLAELWSDANAFAPGSDGKPLFMVDEQGHAGLAEWQAATRLDSASLAAEPGYEEASEASDDFALRPDSPLIGRGPHASVIGPFLRLTVKRPLPIEEITVHDVVDTSATIEWHTPTQLAETTLEWGEGTRCTQRIVSPPASFHTVSLAGLKPGTKYSYRVIAAGQGEELVFATHERQRPPAAVAASQQELLTLAAAPAARTLHVAATGDDSRSGLSPAEAWRTINHAADMARAGDTVLIHGGVYEETVTVRSSGGAQNPITFRAAPGEQVWLDGGGRNRVSAFRLVGKHHVVIDGLRFRHYSDRDKVIRIAGGSHLTIRRCFHDGREANGYVPDFVGAHGSDAILVENCVMINGMGGGLSLSRCTGATVRHCVFYNNFIRPIDILNYGDNLAPAGMIAELSHNLICDNLPEKYRVALLRIWIGDDVRSDHNLYFTRPGETERPLVETANIGGTKVGEQGNGAYYGKQLFLADMRTTFRQEMHSRIGNPGIPVVKELLPHTATPAEWSKVEMHWDGTRFKPLDFKDFMPALGNPLTRADDGAPIGLDPAAFP